MTPAPVPRRTDEEAYVQRVHDQVQRIHDQVPRAIRAGMDRLAAKRTRPVLG